MYNPSNVHAFFEKLSSAAATNQKKPALEMLHSSKPNQTGYIEGSLQEAMMSASAQNPPSSLVATVLNDFGVGLPPLS